MSGKFQVKGADGWVYFYDTEKKIWRKICDVGASCDLPQDVLKVLEASVDEAKAVIAAVEPQAKRQVRR